MDDQLETPSALAPQKAAEDVEDDVQSSDEEDGALDWTKLPSSASNKSFIPKRGEKEYEPTGGQDGTLLQQHRLERMRVAMFAALDVDRTVSNKAVSYAIWDPTVSRAHVLTAHGSHLMSMGHSVPQAVKAANADAKGKDKIYSHVQLLPEEALYLTERGSMFCRKQADVQYPLKQDVFEKAVPMTVQECFAEMIGREDMTLDRYLVFSYLKRLGYIVTRAQPPSTFYPKAQKHPALTGSKKSSSSWLSKFFNLVRRPFQSLFPSSNLDWWKPLPLSGFIHRFPTYSSIFKHLRLFKPGYTLPLYRPPSSPEPESPYKIFYNLYKPGVPFAKTNPRPPDFSIVVVNARTTPMPTIHELSSLFDELPELPPPAPRQRRNPATTSAPNPPSTTGPADNSSNPPPSPPVAPLARLLVWFTSIISNKKRTPPPKPKQPWKPNPFQVLKNGKKIVVVAAVDAGMINFYRFGQGSFDEWPMM